MLCQTLTSACLPPRCPETLDWVDRFDGGPRKGCDILVQALEREGVDQVFAYPGQSVPVWRTRKPTHQPIVGTRSRGWWGATHSGHTAAPGGDLPSCFACPLACAGPLASACIFLLLSHPPPCPPSGKKKKKGGRVLVE